MHIYSTPHIGYNIGNNKQNPTPVNFRANPYSHLLEFSCNDFFVNIRGYGKNKDWARIVIDTADNAAYQMRKNNTSDSILQKIAKGVKEANKLSSDVRRRAHTGILRTERRGYGQPGQWKGLDLYTPVISKYKSYIKRFKQVIKKPLENPYDDIELSKISTVNHFDYDVEIKHGSDYLVNNALDRVGGKFFNLKKNYISKAERITDKDLPDINAEVAEIRWIMAHSMPWERGSDAISNVFMRALYKSMGIKTYPLKKGVSLDLEAFCTPLKEYKQNFGTYFEQPPHVVE